MEESSDNKDGDFNVVDLEATVSAMPQQSCPPPSPLACSLHILGHEL
jgi:hypothetical protein